VVAANLTRLLTPDDRAILNSIAPRLVFSQILAFQKFGMTNCSPIKITMNTMIQKLCVLLSACLMGTYLSAQAPSVTSFMPSSGPIGTSVTITGTNFNTTPANNIVYFGPVRATVTAATATSLNVTVPSGANYQPITVLNTSNGLRGASNLPFQVTFSGGLTLNSSSFAAKLDSTTSTRPSGIAVGDLNGDGRAEVIISNSTSAIINVFRNTHTGSGFAFATKTNLTVPSGATAVIADDFDGDGKLDIAASSSSAGKVALFRNTTVSDISFATRVDSSAGSTIQAIASGDLDGDGKPEIVVANSAASTVSILRNTSTVGNLVFANRLTFATGSSPFSVAIGDIDGDGKLDIVSGNAQAGTISVLRNTSTIGAITFATKVDFTSGGFPFGANLGDVDEDGKLDVLIADQGANKLVIHRNTSTSGTPSFATKVEFNTANAPFRVAVGDLDGDGKVELVVSNNSSNSISLFKNNSTSGTLSLATKVDFATATAPFASMIADLSGDNRPDIAVVNQTSNSVSFFRNTLELPRSFLSFMPTSAGLGDTVMLTGTGLTGALKVNFGDSAATFIQVVSPTKIKAVVGKGATGSVSIFFASDTLSLPGFTFVNCPAPTLDISATPGDTLCPKTRVRLRAKLTQATSKAKLEWNLNRRLISRDTAFNIDTLDHLDTIICILRDTCNLTTPLTDRDTLIFRVKALANFTSSLSPPAICSGTAFTYTPTSNIMGTTFQWRRRAVRGLSNPAATGTGAINEVLNDTTANPINVTYEYFNLSANGCTRSDTFRVVVQVRPIPKLSSSVAPAMVCSGSPFMYTPSSATTGATISWSRAFVNGVSNSSAMGTGAINETLNNTTNAPVNVVYAFTLSANGCPSTGPTNLTVTVKPLPSVNSSSTAAAICSGATFSYIPTSTLPNSTFNWTRAVVVGISNAARTDTGRINEALFNTTANAVNVIYQYTATLNGCTSPTPLNVTVAVNPSPLLNSTLSPAAICSGTAFSYTPTSNNANASFSWTRPVVAGISNAAGAGTGAINETLTNTTTDTVAVVYLYTLVATGCSDPNPTRVTVLVKPRPTLSSTLSPAAICSGTAFQYTPTSATEGTTFAWTRAVVQGISNPAANGNGGINEMLSNTSNGSLNVVYQYTLSAAGCTNPATASVTLTVNRPPSLSSSTTPPAICSGTAFVYTPSSSVQNTSFSWTRAAVAGISNAAANGMGTINEVLNNTSDGPLNVTYVFSLSAGGCTNPQTFNVVVQVRPTPAFVSSLSPPAICSGNSFAYTPLSTAFDASFTWTRAAVQGISNSAANGNGAVNEVLNNTTTAPINVVYAFTVTVNNCSNPSPFNVTVSVRPSPQLSSSVTVPAICSGTSFSYTPSSNITNTTFSWARTVVQGISNAAANGTGSISEVLNNPTDLPVTVSYQYTLSANGCAAAAPSVIEVRVNPLPRLSSASIAPDICSGATFSYVPRSITGGTSFSWTRAAVPGISAPAGNGTGNPAEALNNTTNAPITVVYSYQLTANTCVNPVGFNVEVSVNPLPILTSNTTPTAICSGQTFNYTPSSSVPNTTFSWTRAVINGIGNAAGSGTGNPSEILVNTTAAPITVTYVYTLNLNGCINPTNFPVTVTVNPQPILSSSMVTAPICSGSTFNYTPSSSTIGATFTWRRAAIRGISNPAAEGTGNPNETLNNTTGEPITVTYVYTLNANACANNIGNSILVVVNPVPNFTSDLALEATCSGTVFNYTPSSSSEGATFSWTRAAVTGISNAAANGNGNISETLNNTSTAPITVSYVYTVSANGCTNPATFTVNKPISPFPTLSSSLNPAAICSGTAFTYTPSSTAQGAIFTWSRQAVDGISNASASGSGNINEVLNNTSAEARNVTYRFTLSANGCNNPSSTSVVVAVNAKPTVVINNPAPRCTTLIDLREPGITAGSSAGLSFTYWRDAATTLPVANPQSTDAGVYFIKGTNNLTACFDVKPVTVVIGKIPDAIAESKTICSGIPAGITVLNPNNAPGAVFNWTATYGNVRPGFAKGAGVPFGPNAINEILINLTRARSEVVYTIIPVGAQVAGCEGEAITVRVKVNSIGRACPEAEPSAFKETIRNNTAPQTKVNLVRPKKRKKYLVQYIHNPDSVKGLSKAPYTRPRGAVFEENLLQNMSRKPATVIYTIVPYTNGPNWSDNNGTGDDILGASFDVAVTVQPAPGLVDPNPEIALYQSGFGPTLALYPPPKRATPKPVVTPALLDYFVQTNPGERTDKVILSQNAPNPFQGSSQIGFYLPVAAAARLTIRDAKGAIVYQIKGDYASGWNVLEVQAGMLRATGVLYYTLETQGSVVTKRMVVLK
jgi:hypothetical protein